MRKYLDKTVVFLEHFQNNETSRSNYLIGLMLAAYRGGQSGESKDRCYHYAARELFWSGRPKSAIKLFEKHISMNGWLQERAQSAIFVGQCHEALKDEKGAIEWYLKAFTMDSSRREPLLKLCAIYRQKDDFQKVACYAEAALTIPWNSFYHNDMREYRDIPHGYLYWAYWYLGDKAKSKYHYEKALEYDPTNSQYLWDARVSEPWLSDLPDGWFTLVDMREYRRLVSLLPDGATIVELGTWKGRSLCSIAELIKQKNIKVVAVDTFKGTENEGDAHKEAKQIDLQEELKKNLARYGILDRVTIFATDTVAATKFIIEKGVDLVFVDADHSYEAVKQDIKNWLPKIKQGGIIAGHDFLTGPGVKKAVNETFKNPNTANNIWSVTTPNTVIIDKFISKIWNNEPFSFIKLGDGEQLCMDGAKGVNCDGHPYSVALGIKLKNAFIYFNTMTNCYVPLFNDQPYFNTFLHRTDNDINRVKEFFKAVRDKQVDKIYVGPERLAVVAKMLKAFHIIVPEVNAFEKYDDTLYQIKRAMEYRSIVLFSAGMMTKSLIHETLVFFNNATCIDVGSSFDPMVGQSRTYQISKEDMLKLYSDWIEEDNLPLVSFLIPTLNRPEGLKRCVESIVNLDYPEHLKEIILLDGAERTVPQKVKDGVEKAKGDVFVFAADDMEFTTNCIKEAVKASKKKGLVSFNSGPLYPDNGNINEHFLIRKDMLPRIGGEIFCTRLNHCGCDNLLWAKCSKLDEAMWCEEAVINHYHFTKGAKMDDTYKKGWSKVDEDRKILAEELSKLGVNA